MKITDLKGGEWELSVEEGYEAKHTVHCQQTLSCAVDIRFEDLTDAEALIFLLEKAH